MLKPKKTTQLQFIVKLTLDVQRTCVHKNRQIMLVISKITSSVCSPFSAEATAMQRLAKEAAICDLSKGMHAELEESNSA